MSLTHTQGKRDRRTVIVARFGETLTDPALRLLDHAEYAWHAGAPGIVPSEHIIDDELPRSKGDIAMLIEAALGLRGRPSRSQQ